VLGFRLKFFARWPGNWNALSLDLAVHLGWGPTDIDEVEGDQLIRWVGRLNEINAAKKRKR
jgi:hypothetical protein